MIVTMAVYALVLSLTIGVIAVLVERGATMLRWPVRRVWMLAMGAMVIAPLAMLALSHAQSSRRVETSPIPTLFPFDADAPRNAPADDPREKSSAGSVATTVATHSAMDSWNGVLVRLAHRTAAWDHTLALLWFGLSVAVLLSVLKEARAMHRLTRSMPTRTIGGTTVCVSDTLGPAAIGGRTPSIVLPAWVLEMDDALLELVLQHEREHLAASDPRMLTIGIGWLVLMPWHVPLWWAWHRLRLAIELDCDARVLRGSGTPRVYAQLLLFISRQRTMLRLRDLLARPLLLAFNPQRHHLQKRISAMTSRSNKHPVRLMIVGSAIAATTTLAVAIPAPRVITTVQSPRTLPSTSAAADSSRGAPSAILRVHKLGLSLAETTAPGSRRMEIVLYGNGEVRLGLGASALAELRDTVRLDHLPAFSADVTNGDVHVELRRVAGTLELGGDASGAAMKSFSVRGRHVVLAKGGAGVRAVPATGAAAVKGRVPSKKTVPVNEREWRLADSVAARSAALELERAKLVARYSASFPGLREAEAKLTALNAVSEGLPMPARQRVRAYVIRTLEERHDGLGLEREQLLLKYEESSQMVTNIAKERAALEARRQELRTEASAPARR